MAKEKKQAIKAPFIRTRGKRVGEVYVRYFKTNDEMRKALEQMAAHLLIIAEVEAYKGK